ncbi:MAG: hypothetical protein IT442_06155, partial [Phycisphaeraceae bacterium]|nr:hypothetical protein [Phycisphaeraceae bacterium]
AGLTLSLDRLSLHGDPKLNGLSLSDVTLTARTDPASQSLASELTAQLGYAGQSAKITSQSTANLDKLPAINGAQSKVRVEGLPVALIDQLAGSAGTTPSQPGRYVSLIGPTVDRLEWTTQYLSPDSGAEVQMMLQAPRLSALASVQWLPGRSIQLIGSDNRVVLKLTPESFAAWLASSAGPSDANSTWQLVDPVDVSLTIPQARIGFKPSASPDQAGGVDLSTAKLNLQATVPTLSLRRADGTPLALQGLGVAVSTEDPRKLIHLNLQGQVVGVDAAAGTRTSNPLRSDTQITGLIDGQGKLDLAHAVIVTDTAVEQLPTSLLVGTLGLDPAYVQTLGPWVSLTAKGRYPGDVDILLRSPNIDAPAALTIDADRTLHLRSDAVFSVVLTEQLGDSLLKYGSPLLVGVRSSDQPIKLTLRKDTLSLPLAQWDLSKLALDAKLDLGTVSLSRSWAQRDWEKALSMLATTLGVVTQSVMPQSSDQTTTRGITSMTFGPLEASLRNGVVSTNDLWMSDQLNALGVKGRINLVDHTFDANMGILGESLLRRVPALRKLGVVDAAAVYQFPVRGSIESPQVDMGPFVKQIAQAAIKQQAAGQLLGQLGGDARLGAAAGLLDAFLSQTTSGDADVSSAWPNRPTMPPLPESMQQPAPTEQTQQPAEPSQQQSPPRPIEGLLQQLLQQPKQQQPQEQPQQSTP